jgi:2-polyprenyl-3-methyl-5-hydroxy-6-metoxy-1,4-benzoquinol methylase
MPDKKQLVEGYFNKTDGYLNDNLVIGLRSKLIVNSLPKIENKDILDIGCGNGEITLTYIKNNKITFLDLSCNMLDLVRSRILNEYYNNAEFVNAEFGAYAYDKKFDYIFLIGVLAHVESIDETISKLSVLLKHDGDVIIQYTNSRNIISGILRMIGYFKSAFNKRYGYKINFFSTKEIISILNQYGLKCYNKISYWPALPGFKLIPKGIRGKFYYKILNSSFLHSLGGEKILFIKSS